MMGICLLHQNIATWTVNRKADAADKYFNRFSRGYRIQGDLGIFARDDVVTGRSKGHRERQKKPLVIVSYDNVRTHGVSP